MTRSPVIRRRDNRSCNSSRGRSCHRYHVAGRVPRSLTGVAPYVEARHYATPRRIRRQNRIAPSLALAHVARKRSEEHTSELQSLAYLVCRLLLEKKNK